MDLQCDENVQLFFSMYEILGTISLHCLILHLRRDSIVVVNSTRVKSITQSSLQDISPEFTPEIRL